jgi:hypothetical protein
MFISGKYLPLLLSELLTFPGFFFMKNHLDLFARMDSYSAREAVTSNLQLCSFFKPFVAEATTRKRDHPD